MCTQTRWLQEECEQLQWMNCFTEALPREHRDQGRLNDGNQKRIHYQRPYLINIVI